MILKMLLCILFTILVHVVTIAAMTHEHNRSMILRKGINSYCDITCDPNNTKYTLCDPIKEAACEDFKLFDEDTFRDILWKGHNGLRNREASLFAVSDMRRMEWDPELAEMAKYWLMQCKELEMDPCTQFEDRNGSTSYKRVSQSVGFHRSPFLPQHFFYSMIREWYVDSSGMNLLEINDTTYFRETNRYVQMIWAKIWRIGCAAAAYNGGFGVVCNYYGFDGIQQPAWHNRKPCSRCPRRLPLCSTQFEHLCTADSADRFMPIFTTIVLILFAQFFNS